MGAVYQRGIVLPVGQACYGQQYELRHLRGSGDLRHRYGVVVHFSQEVWTC